MLCELMGGEGLGLGGERRSLENKILVHIIHTHTIKKKDEKISSQPLTPSLCRNGFCYQISSPQKKGK